MIKIGVSACFMYPDPNRTFFGPKTLAYFEQDMANYLTRKDVMPILIPNLAWEKTLQYLEYMDGFVFQGGSDVCPRSYGAELIENGRWPGDEKRDQYELKIMDWAFKNKRPIFSICRGMQLTNVYFGGTLYQDLKIQTQTEIEHRHAEKYDHINHAVKVVKNGLLDELYQRSELQVNSVHHQGIDRLGKNLIVDATSEKDQLVEAFHYQNMEEHFVMAVQWHPEFSQTLGNKVADPAPLYDYFLNYIKKQRGKR